MSEDSSQTDLVQINGLNKNKENVVKNVEAKQISLQINGLNNKTLKNVVESGESKTDLFCRSMV